MGNPFQIFSWHQPFLPALKTYIEENFDPGRTAVIVPNDRPWRYFLELYRGDKKAALLPRFFTFNETASLWGDSAGRKPAKILNSLDQTGLLFECVKSLTPRDRALEQTFSEMTYEQFLPWGFRLAELFEDMISEGCEARDIAVGAEDVGRTAAPLLNSLGRIMTAWRARLDADGFSTPALETARALAAADLVPEALRPGDGKEVLIAGFYSLNGLERVLLKSLWDKGARVCLHTDPLILENKGHWATREHEKWLNKWKARAELIGDATPTEARTNFFSGYDVHSQLKKFNEKINAVEDESAAVILTSPGLLMPALHHAPNKNINISMGYPLSRGPFKSLLENIFSLHFSRDKSGDFYWREIVSVLRQPYLKMLSLNKDGETISPREAFQIMEKKASSGSKFVNFASFYNEAKLAFPPATAPLLDEWKKIIFDTIRPEMTIAEMGGFLKALIGLFETREEDVRKRFPLDAEVISRIKTHILPVFENSVLAERTLPLSAHYFIIMELLKAERVAFQADPLMGAQILGLLETRLLQFDKLFIMDATEDALPGAPGPNPLLPDSLRAALGLPDATRKEKIVAHNLARLCACAKEINFFWQEGDVKSGLSRDKKFRSRFVEERVWNEERKAGKIFKPGEGPLETAVASVIQKPKDDRGANATTEIKEAVKKFLASAISPTALDVYLQCPYKFASQYLFNVQAPPEVEEEEDATLIGECIHKILENLYLPYKDRECAKKEINLEKIKNELERQAAEYDLKNRLPVASWLYFQLIAPRKLKNYFESQPDVTIPHKLESQIEGSIKMGDGELKLKGRADRIDKRDGKLFVLDYKTGSPPAHADGLWEDDAFFAELKKYSEPGVKMDERADELMTRLREDIGSLQLPAYITMLRESGEGEVGDAAFVDLRDSGKEKGIFEGLDDEQKARAIEHCETALAFVARHMLESNVYSAQKGSKCDWCAYADLCES